MKKLTLLFLLSVLSLHLFGQVTEDNSYYVKDYSEAKAKAYLDSDPYLDDIEGIWQSSDGFKYAIEKDVENGRRVADKFRVIILETGFDGWKATEIKAFLSLSSLDRIYSMKYYSRQANRSGLVSENILLVLENPILASYQRSSTGDKISIIKLYPKVDGVGQGADYNSGSPSDNNVWSGSSIVVGKKYIATNFHVVDGAKSLVVTGINGNTSTDYDAEVVCVDKVNDLAIVKITDSRFTGFRPPKYGIKTTTADVGTEVFVLGYPLTTLMGEEIKLTTGVVSSKSGFQGDVSLYQISASIQPGNSGGPLFDGQGNLIGIVNAKLQGAENVGYAIKLTYLRNLIESANEEIEFNYSNNLSSYNLTDKVKAISPYVLMVKANTKVSNNERLGKGGNNSTVSGSSTVNKAEASRLYNSAKENYANKNYTQALIDIERSITIMPTSEAYFYRGLIALYLKDFDKVEDSYAYCIERNYKLEVCYYNLALTHLYRNNLDRCIDYCGKALNIDRKFIQAYRLRGDAKDNLNDKDGALADYEQAVKYEGIVDFPNQGWADLYNLIAFEYLNKNEILKAVENIKKAIELDSTDGNIWDTYGQIQYKVKNWDSCVYCMNIAITLGKKTNGHWLDKSYYYRGLAKKELGFFSDAYNDLKEAAKLDNPDAEEACLSFDKTTLDDTKTMSFSRIVKNPSVAQYPHKNIAIQAVELTEEYTAVYLAYTNTEYPSGGWYSIESEASIIEKKTGKRRRLIATENCAISPQKSGIQINTTEKFVLYFAPLDKDCNEFDLIESKSSEWKFYGINLSEVSSKKRGNLPNSEGLTVDDIQVVTDESFVKGLTFVETIKKTSGWGNAAGNLGRENAIKMCKKEAAKRGCQVILITDVDYDFTTSVTAQLYRRP